MRIGGITSTDLFGGTAARPLQIVRVTLVNEGSGLVRDPAAVITVEVGGAGVSTRRAQVSGLRPGEERVIEVAVAIAAPHSPGSTREVTAVARAQAAGTGQARAQAAGRLTVAEPGWTMWMVSHFHYDPVWWNTQGQFTQSRLMLPGPEDELPDVRTAFDLVRLHLAAARQDPDYKFVLAEIDYLKPHFDAFPEDRADLIALIRAGRIEIVGGSYNEPNTNLTCAESTIRNAVYGLAFQREVLGADPRTAWMLDAFGFDPAYPGLMAGAGLRESAWARGPFHQWGPSRSAGDNRLMQFASEFEWLSPDGTGLLTGYMPNHYSAGWGTHQAADLAAAEADAYQQFSELAPVAASRNVLLPVGTDHVIPSRWVTGIHRDWNARYTWPRFVTAVPSEFFAAVRQDAALRGSWLLPQTRDMNPVYTGKDVSYIDTKQAQRAAEIAVQDGERLATLAWLAGARYPAASLDKAWRLLVFGAHHDAITGCEGDQVYLDLLGGWREAFERGDEARRDAAGYLAGLAATGDAGPAAGPSGARAMAGGGEAAGIAAIVVFNMLSRARDGMATITLEPGGPAGPGPAWIGLRDDTGAEVPFLAEGAVRHPDGSLAAVTVTFRARAVPSLGYRSYLVTSAPLPDAARSGGWQAADGHTISNDSFAVTADPASGGTLARLLDRRTGTDLLAGPGNELVLQPEYPAHPRWNEGPWLLCPAGPGTGCAAGGQACAPSAARWAAAWSPRSRSAGCGCGRRRSCGTARAGWSSAPTWTARSGRTGCCGSGSRPWCPAACRSTRARCRWSGARSGWPTPTSPSTPTPWTTRRTSGSASARPPGWRWPARTADGGCTRSASPRSSRRTGPPNPGPPNPRGECRGRGRRAGRGHCGRLRAGPSRKAGGSWRAAVRDLMIALARTGVTATCSVPDGPRYGAIEVDSNLPDFRIAVGGPEQNAFTRRLLDAVGEPARSELGRQLAGPGPARIWVPAAQSRAAAFGPGADLRGPRDLPVLIVAGADLDKAIGDLTDDLANAVIEVPATAGAGRPEGAGTVGPQDPELAGHCVALLNRGTPSSLVTPDGVLHISLMRACSTWPSGVWIDGDKRTAPDGSSFAWQHWSHTFEYALAAGTGDWRSAGFALAGQDYNHDLLASQAGLHAGPLPAAASLAAAEPDGALLTALKPRGNPLAPGAQPRPGDGVTARLADSSGGAGPAAAVLRLFTGIAAARATDLTEDADDGPLPCQDGAALVELPAAGTATVRLIPDPAGLISGGPGGRGNDAASAEPARPAEPASPAEPVDPAEPAGPAELPEPVQPVFTRYWLHGKGPAPAGNLPVAVHLAPGRLPLRQGRPGRLRLTVGCGPAPAAGSVSVRVPPGLSVDPAGPLGYDLPPNGHARWDLAVSAGPGAWPGRAYVTAQISDPAGQVLEDAAVIAVGEPDAPGELDGTGGTDGPGRTGAPGLPLDRLVELVVASEQAGAAEAGLRLLTPELTLPPGGRGEIAVRLANRTCSALRGEAQLLSPFGSWALVRPWTLGFGADPGTETTMTFAVSVPATARPGQHWWALVKVMYFGRLRYSAAASVLIAG